jgi:hypothetical protein
MLAGKLWPSQGAPLAGKWTLNWPERGWAAASRYHITGSPGTRRQSKLIDLSSQRSAKPVNVNNLRSVILSELLIA